MFLFLPEFYWTFLLTSDGATRRVHGTAPENGPSDSSGILMSPNFPSALGTDDDNHIYYFEGRNSNDRIYIAFSDFDIKDRYCPVKVS